MVGLGEGGEERYKHGDRKISKIQAQKTFRGKENMGIQKHRGTDWSVEGVHEEWIINGGWVVGGVSRERMKKDGVRSDESAVSLEWRTAVLE